MPSVGAKLRLLVAVSLVGGCTLTGARQTGISSQSTPAPVTTAPEESTTSTAVVTDWIRYTTDALTMLEENYLWSDDIGWGPLREAASSLCVPVDMRALRPGDVIGKVAGCSGTVEGWMKVNVRFATQRIASLWSSAEPQQRVRLRRPRVRLRNLSRRGGAVCTMTMHWSCMTEASSVWRIRSRRFPRPIECMPGVAGGTRTVRGMRSGSAPPCTSTATSRRPARIAVSC